MLEQVYKSYLNLANQIDWKKYSINDLFVKAIENENTDLYEKYYAGIICRVWGYSGRVYHSVNRHIPFEQCYDIVIDAVNYVLEKRVWENPESSLYGDKSAPDKAFHISLKRQRSIVLANLTADKRQSNFNNLSIDEFHEAYNDSSDGMLFEGLCSSESDNNLGIYISSYFDNDDYIEAFALDSICYGQYGDYSVDKIIKIIKNLDNKDFKYYKMFYNLSNSKYKKYLKEISRTNKQIIEYHIKKLLYNLREEFN